jgi:predicted transcriptional regulator with HTH domain
MGKSMERIINTRLNWLLETNNVIANEQAGFRMHRLTSERIAKLRQFIKDALDNKRKLTAVFIDFKSAYDSVLKENLLFKLIRSGIRSNLLQWLQSFISHRACKVRCGEHYSKCHMIQQAYHREPYLALPCLICT